MHYNSVNRTKNQNNISFETTAHNIYYPSFSQSDLDIGDEILNEEQTNFFDIDLNCCEKYIYGDNWLMDDLTEQLIN